MSRPRESPLLYVAVQQQGAGGVITRVDLSESVISMSYEETEKAADKLTLSINNYTLEEFDRPYWRKGNVVEVSWGYPGRMAPTRACVIQAVKGFSTLAIEALGQGILMHKVARTRSFKAQKRSDVVAAVARENGYGESEQHIEDSAVVHEAIEQIRETDAAFLMRMAKREGYEFYIDFDGLHWHRRQLGQRAVREYEYFTDPGQGDVLSISVENDVTTKPAVVQLVGRDPMQKRDINVTASEANTQRTGLAPALEVVDPRTGKSTLQAGSGQALILTTTDPNAAAAKRTADGIYANGILTTVQLKMKCVGDPEQLAKTVITIKGIRSLSGNYWVEAVKTSISQTYDMELTCKRDGRTHLQPAGAAAKAKQNDAPATGDPGQLSPREVVDPRTGKTQIQYVPANGRAQGTGAS